MFEALHNEFVASAKTVIEGHKINPDFMIGNMIAHTTLYPLTPNPKDILAAFEEITLKTISVEMFKYVVNIHHLSLDILKNIILILLILQKKIRRLLKKVQLISIHSHITCQIV